MKKIFRENLASFREKDLKQYSRIINQYFKRKWRFVFVFVLVSCSVQNQIEKADFKKIPKTMMVRFYDKLDTIQHQYGNQSFTRSFMNEFTDKKNIDFSVPIELQLQKNDLYVKFQDDLKKQFVIKVSGKRKQKRFVFYLNYETVSFPIIFISKQMIRYTIEFPTNDSILISRSYTNEGMLLFLGGGSSYQNEYIFKIIKDE
ncbi:MAG: hypothetical protein ACOVNP_02225 [Flavobacterium sp.]